jgi:hypothetical protein
MARREQHVDQKNAGGWPLKHHKMVYYGKTQHRALQFLWLGIECFFASSSICTMCEASRNMWKPCIRRYRENCKRIHKYIYIIYIYNISINICLHSYSHPCAHAYIYMYIDRDIHAPVMSTDEYHVASIFSPTCLSIFWHSEKGHSPLHFILPIFYGILSWRRRSHTTMSMPKEGVTPQNITTRGFNPPSFAFEITGKPRGGLMPACLPCCC